MNTFDLDPEWGAIDLLGEVEASFGIKIEDAVAWCFETVADLYDAIRNLTPAWDDQQGSCASSMTFYHIRRALSCRYPEGLYVGSAPNVTISTDRGSYYPQHKVCRL